MPYLLKNIKQVAEDIKTIKIQGATNIAKSAFKILIQESKVLAFGSQEIFFDFVENAVDLLSNARPTEPMLFNGMDYIKNQLAEKLKETNDVRVLQNTLTLSAQHYLDLIKETAQLAVNNGLGIIDNGYNVVTHCHSGSVVKTITLHKEHNIDFKVYNTETRPLYQGRKTSRNLLNAGVDTTMVTDSIAPFLIGEISGEDLMVDCVIIWCDAIKLDGGIINKSGTYSIGLSALHANIPLYVAGNLLKTDIHNSIEIERRESSEIWKEAPEGLKFINFAFDRIPPKFITGIITEFGIFRPKDIRKVIEKNYPWMNIA